MTVYIELVFFENFAIDYFLLLSGEKITYIKAQHPVIAAIFGAVYSVIMPLFYNTSFLQTTIILALMCLICFKIRSLKNFIYLMMAISACAGALFGFLNLFSSSFQTGIFYEDDVFFVISLCCVLSSIGLYRLLIPFMRKKTIEEGTAILNLEGQQFSAFIDSGNSLYYKNLPVILINKNLLSTFPEKPLIIPYSAIGEKGALLGYHPKKVLVTYMNKNFQPKCVVALCDNDFHKKFDALLHPDIIMTMLMSK